MHLAGRSLVLIWVASLLLHIAAVAIMFFVMFPYAPNRQERLPVTRAELIGDLEAASFTAPRETESRQVVQLDPLDVRYAPKEFDPLSEVVVTKKPELRILAIGAGGGDFSEYGLTGGSGAVEFFGLGGSARGVRRVVYVVDQSGSMLDTFGYVRDELQRSISKLRRTQKFHVIFFNWGRPLESPPKRLVSAIQGQKRQFFNFLETVHPEGGTHPEQAMRRALALDPDLIYFLTDGEFDASLIGKLDQWNRDRHVRIFTIAYFDRAGAQLLEHIAREHRGEFKFVSEDDIP